MQADSDLRIEPVQEAHHPHMELIVCHGCVSIFRYHVVDSDDSRIRTGGFEAEQGLREYLLFRKAAQYLVEVSDFHMTSGRCIGLPAVFAPRPLGLSLIQSGSGCCYVVPQSSLEELIAQTAEIFAPSDFLRDRCRVAEIG